jgi:hypothetical protein
MQNKGTIPRGCSLAESIWAQPGLNLHPNSTDNFTYIPLLREIFTASPFLEFSRKIGSMRLLQRNSAGQLSLTKNFVGDDIPKCAILLHTWGADTEEVTFQDLMDRAGKGKVGYKKIRFCGERASRDGLQHFWVDSCCIDKSNAVELQEAINSMFR